MSAHRPEIFEAKGFEHHSRRHDGLHGIDKFGTGIAQFAVAIEHIPHLIFYFAKRGVGQQGIKMLVHRPYVRRNGHLVVVQNDEQILLQHPAIVQRFVGNAARHGTISDHSGDFVLFAIVIARGRDAKRGADGCRCVSRAEDIVRALFAFQKWREAVFLANGLKPVFPSR